MTLRQVLSRAGLALLLLASLAMSASAFAHRAAPSDPEMLAYLSMGGTLEELCGDAGLSHHQSTVCEACRISANALAPETAQQTLAPVVYAVSRHATPATTRVSPCPAQLTPPSRAPPLT